MEFKLLVTDRDVKNRIVTSGAAEPIFNDANIAALRDSSLKRRFSTQNNDMAIRFRCTS